MFLLDDCISTRYKWGKYTMKVDTKHGVEPMGGKSIEILNHSPNVQSSSNVKMQRDIKKSAGMADN
jgi:hypothetical protein